MPQVVVVRPGCTDFDVQNRIQGSLDLPLNGRGRQQVDELCERLRETDLSAVYTSPADPASSTATAIGDSLGIPVKQKDELRNVDQGLWQGLPLEDVKRKYPRVFRQWRESPESVCPPKGESVPDALERIRKGLGKPLKRKAAFAVVASEPLATLIECVVSGNRPVLSNRLCGSECTPDIEILDSGERSGDNGESEKRSSAAGNGAATTSGTNEDESG